MVTQVQLPALSADPLTIVLWKNAALGARDILGHAVGNTTAACLEVALSTWLLPTPVEALVVTSTGLPASRP